MTTRARAVAAITADSLHERYEALEVKVARQSDAMQRIEDKADRILRAIGDEGEDDYGRPIGTGIVGRLMRLERRVERRFGLYDGLKRYAGGLATGVALVGGILWWVISERIGSLLK